MRSRSKNTLVLAFATGVLIASSASPWSVAPAYTLKTLYAFCGQTNCSDGAHPDRGLLMDASGDLYGVTRSGGAYGAGVVFELFLDVNKTKWIKKILYNFCPQAGCTDGQSPNSTMIMDTSGDLYGTTQAGGRTGHGIAFELIPNAGRTKWRLKVLHSFCTVGGSACRDGDENNGDEQARLTYADATTGALYDGVSPLYGTTIIGAVNKEGLSTGVVFELMPEGKRWSESVLHAFCRGNHCIDGELPAAGLIVDAAGNLYGTTVNGGPKVQGSYLNGGTVFELIPNADKSAWTETLAVHFCGPHGCQSGQYPFAGVVMDQLGNLFGATWAGGVGANCPSGNTDGCGVLFKRTPGGASSVLYNFCSLPNCADGVAPTAGLVADSAGNLFGTTESGGAANLGLVYELGAADGTEHVLYDFCTEPDCTDGESPLGELTLDSSGNLYGTTTNGGPNNGGTVFELTP